MAEGRLMSRRRSQKLIQCLIGHILKPTLGRATGSYLTLLLVYPQHVHLAIGSPCCSGCLACRCLVAAKAGNHTCCLDYGRDFRMHSQGQDGLRSFWFVSSAPFPKGGSHCAQLCAGSHGGLQSCTESFFLQAESVLGLACELYSIMQEV